MLSVPVVLILSLCKTGLGNEWEWNRNFNHCKNIYETIKVRFLFPDFFRVLQLLLELSEDYSLVKGKVPCKRGITVTVDLLVDLSCSLEWNLETKTLILIRSKSTLHLIKFKKSTEILNTACTHPKVFGYQFIYHLTLHFVTRGPAQNNEETSMV